MGKIALITLISIFSTQLFSNLVHTKKVHEQYIDLFKALGSANIIADVLCEKNSGKAIKYSEQDNYNESELISCIRVDNMKRAIFRDLLKILPSSIVKLDDVFINFSYLEFPYDSNEFQSKYIKLNRDISPDLFLENSLKKNDYISKISKKYLKMLIQIKGVKNMYKGYCDTYLDEYSYYEAENFKECVFIELKTDRDYIDIYRVLKRDTIVLDSINFHFVLNTL